MTAPLFHMPPGSLDEAQVGSPVLLDGAEGHHAATVMRLQAGEDVLLSDTQSTLVTGVVLESGQGRLMVEVVATRTEPQQVPELVLVQALAKDKRDLQAVESATELGVDRVIPWQADRSVARWKAGREQKKHAEWTGTAKPAAKQTRRIRVPVVEPMCTSRQYVQRIAADPNAAVLVLDEADEVSLHDALRRCGALQDGSPVRMSFTSSSARRAGSVPRSWVGCETLEPIPAGWVRTCSAPRPQALLRWPRSSSYSGAGTSRYPDL